MKKHGIIKDHLSLILTASIFAFSLSACAGGDKDNNGKEDNRNRKIWNENDRKQKMEEKLRNEKLRNDTTSAAKQSLK